MSIMLMSVYKERRNLAVKSYQNGDMESSKRNCEFALRAANDLVSTACDETSRALYKQLVSDMIYLHQAIDSAKEGVSATPHKKESEDNKFLSKPQTFNTGVIFDDIIGLEDVKDSIKRMIISPLKNREIFRKYGSKPGGAVLLAGSPGTGKTTIAKAIANMSNTTFIEAKCSDLVNMYLGESEKAIAALFENARKNLPAIIFFDECDYLAGKREGDNKASKAILSALLPEMDGLRGNLDNILVLFATNLLGEVDSGILSRCSIKINVPLPDEKAIAKIFESLLRDDLPKSELDYNAFARLTAAYKCSGRDIKNICGGVRFFLADKEVETGKEQVCTDDIVAMEISKYFKYREGRDE